MLRPLQERLSASHAVQSTNVVQLLGEFAQNRTFCHSTKHSGNRVGGRLMIASPTVAGHSFLLRRNDTGVVLRAANPKYQSLPVAMIQSFTPRSVANTDQPFCLRGSRRHCPRALPAACSGKNPPEPHLRDSGGFSLGIYALAGSFSARRLMPRAATMTPRTNRAAAKASWSRLPAVGLALVLLAV